MFTMSPLLCIYTVTIVTILQLCSLPSSGRDYETIGKLKDLGIKTWFSEQDKSLMKQKRIRKEVRDLSDPEWQAIANAMNTMKFTDGDTGRSQYGDDFLSYDELVCWHTRTAFSSQGDFGHGYPHFGMWHRAFMLLFERSLLSVDKGISSFPYWDYRIDATDPKNSIIFSEAYLGDLMGDSSQGYAIRNGPFAYWPIGFASDVGCGDTQAGKEFNNIFGLMRSYVNPNPSLFVTRIGERLCTQKANNVGDADKWASCLEENEFISFVQCYESGVHVGGHTGVGGTTRRKFIDTSSEEYARATNGIDPNDTMARGLWCHNWLDCQHVSTTDHQIFRFYSHPRNGCFSCDKCALRNDDTKQLVGLSKEEIGACVCKPTTDCSLDISDFDDGTEENPYQQNELNHYYVEHVWGDMLDAISSVNDPIFFFHHFNMDRYTYLWQIEMFTHREEYYLYPQSGFEYGINLGDVSSPEIPFDGSLFDWQGEKRKELVTIKDIFDELSFVNAPYIYDDIYEAIFAPDSDYTDYMTQKESDHGKMEENRKNAVKSGDEDGMGGMGPQSNVSLLVLLSVTGLLLTMAVICRVIFVKSRENKMDGNDKNQNMKDNIPLAFKNVDFYGSTRTDMFV